MGKRTCPNCKLELDPDYAFCPECGSCLDGSDAHSQSEENIAETETETDVAPEPETVEKAPEPPAPAAEPPPPVRAAPSRKAASTDPPYRIVRLARGGGQRSEYDLPNRGLVIGRVNVDISFPNDETVSPRHATLRPKGGMVELDDTGSQNGIYTRLKKDINLTEGDTFMCGDQLFRFSLRPAHFHSGDFRHYGSPQEKKVLSILTHILAEGIEGEVFPIRTSSFTIGRDEGDIRYGTDRFMSRKHTVIKKTDRGFVLSDQNSRNGTYLCRRGTLSLVDGDIFMIGRQMLRLEAVTQ
ncbi:MAG: FHA domain-containing protein [Deltaproteobacteria bacterium]|nr:FHA domain-containing protein [Deltaproteobacteria bacterium]